MRFKLQKAARNAAAVGLATAMVSLGAIAVAAPPAGADPVYTSALVGVGSNTTQDLFNAFAGASPFPAPVANAGLGQEAQASKYFTGIHSSDATGDVGLQSWDAVDPTTLLAGCLTKGAKPGFAEVDRPNGSGAGANALSDANDGDAWDPTTNCGQSATSAGDAAGQFDFARSSSGPSGVGTALTFIPFARDGVSYLYYSPVLADHGAAGAGNLSSTTLETLFGTGGTPNPTGTTTVTVASVTYTLEACMMQAGSGTGKFWDGAMGNNGAGTTSQQSAINSGCSDTLEENGGNAFVNSTFVQALTGNEIAIIPFSAGSWIAQANLVARDRTDQARTDGANLGSIDSFGEPYTGTPGSEVPNAAFYASTVYGRDLYVVVPTSKLGGPAGSNGALKTLFTTLNGNAPPICSAAAATTINSFGFTTTLAAGQTCGETGVAALEEAYTQ